jgi:Amidase
MSAAVPVSEMGMVITMQESSPAPRGSLPELCTFGGIALADMIRRRKVSAEEVMATYLDHIGRTNPAVNAIISLRPRDELLAEAREADDAVARGKVLGPLHGVPQAIKDLALTRGLLTTFGSHLFADFVPDEDAIIVERMRAADGCSINWKLGRTAPRPDGGFQFVIFRRRYVFGHRKCLSRVHGTSSTGHS